MEVKARMPGQVMAINVAVGDAVNAKDVLGTIEAMKMEQPIPCPKAGTVKEIKIAVGDKVKSGQVLFVIE
ncbi:MAG TPA: biotin/lipoyl-binding protein [Clostridiales bacterium]|jgi:biotin carboxyl carrier protein|nr:biotin/lipoyl-binding protein [Clostridiales bacterium]